MIKPPLTNAMTDPILPDCIQAIKETVTSKDDDWLTLVVGEPGCGKSALMCIGMELYHGERASLDYIGFNKEDFARALKVATESPKPRFCGYDEANISKRDSFSDFNKDMIDLYLAIRGTNVWHWWNNPSLDMIDKYFIEERIDSVIYIYSKSVSPRMYYYFTKKQLLKIFEKEGKLTLTILKKNAEQFALYRGYFKKYDGRLWEEYLKRKAARMTQKIGIFWEKYGMKADMVSATSYATSLGVSHTTVTKWVNRMLTSGELQKDKDVLITATKRIYIHVDSLDKLKDKMEGKNAKPDISSDGKEVDTVADNELPGGAPVGDNGSHHDSPAELNQPEH